jgi:propionyl-CoA carboxylase alpha chain
MNTWWRKLGADGQHRTSRPSVTSFESSDGQRRGRNERQALRDREPLAPGRLAIRGTVDGKAFMAQMERSVGKNPLAIRIATTAPARQPWC